MILYITVSVIFPKKFKPINTNAVKGFCIILDNNDDSMTFTLCYI